MINQNIINFIAEVAIVLPAFIVALSCHEFSHALAATILGDNTAKEQGRLTLNPLAHISFLGTLFLLIFKIGWAKPVPFKMENFKHPRLYSILTALAGPLANFIVAFLCFLILKYVAIFNISYGVKASFMQVFEVMAQLNVMLGVFNLMPIPPLDGSHFIFAALYKKFPHVIIWLYRYSMFILLALFMLPQTRDLLLTLIYYVTNFIKSLAFSF